MMDDLKLFKEGNDAVLVWCTKDIMQLKSKYRIAGKLIGSHPKMARQNQLLSRPMLLNPYEVTLLLEKGFARLCEHVAAPDEDISKHRQNYSEYHKKSLDDQRKLAYEQKRSDILSRSEEIVAGMMKKHGTDEHCATEEKATVIESILSNIKPIEEQHMLVQQPTERVADSTITKASWSFPHTESDRSKYLVFKDLWQQQLILTRGAKFGGDFLVYPGDPELYHAKYIAVCQPMDSSLQPTDVVQIARLASNVKKTALVCKPDLVTGKVMYIKLDYNPR